MKLNHLWIYYIPAMYWSLGHPQSLCEFVIDSFISCRHTQKTSDHCRAWHYIPFDGTQTDTTKNCTDAQASAMLKNLALLLHWNTSNTEHVKLYTSTVYWEDMKCLVNHILSQNKQYISISKVYQYPHEDLKHPETVSTIMSSKPQLPERCVTVPKGRPHRLFVICF